jgi:hypothetical protein
MHKPKAMNMLTSITLRLSRLLPQTAPARPDDGDLDHEDRSCYNSSFDLARGLEVIEHRGPPGAAFCDTLPAYRWPRA